jgi:hypothetical protein
VLAGFSEAAGSRVRVLGVDVSDDAQSAVGLLTDAGVHYPSVRDPQASTRAPLRWTGLPMTVLVDADGVVRHVERAPLTSDAQLRDLVAAHLGVDVPGATPSRSGS